MSRLNIRPAEEKDLNAVHALICQLEDFAIPLDELSRIYLKNLKQESIYYYVAEEENQIIGFVSMHIQYLLHHYAAVAEVQEICIHDSCRGKGYGKILLDFVKEKAKALDCDLIELCTNKKRSDAHRFYDREGWRQSHFKYTFPFRKEFL